MMGKIKQLLRNNGFENNDMVFSVPSYYTEAERKALLDAAKIAEITVNRLFNESSAIALGYGIFKKAELTAEARNTVFVDMGHSKLSAFCAAVSKDKCSIVGESFDRNCGARDLDWAVAELLAKKFQETYGSNPMNKEKPRLRLLDAVEKCRKVLSANNEAGISLEYLMEEDDLNDTVTREQFEKLIAAPMAKVRACLVNLKDQLVKKNIKLHEVEIIGGCTRIPIVQSIIMEVFGVETL